MFFGMSISTGPGRPVVAMWNASRTARGMSSALVTNMLCLVIERVIPVVSHLLEGVRADGRQCHLARDAHHGHRVEVGIGQRGDDVGRRRTTGDHTNPRTPSSMRITFGRVTCSLLVTDEHVSQLRVDDRVVYGEDGPARIAEYHLDALQLQLLMSAWPPFSRWGWLVD